MHEEEVAGLRLCSDDLADARCHRYGGNPGGADQRIDLVTRDDVHDLAEDDAARRAADKGDESEHDDEQRVAREEVLRRHRHARARGEENRDDVAQRILRRIRKAVGDARLTEEVAEHEHAQKRCDRRQQQADEDGRDEREDDLLELRDVTQLLHDDLALRLRREELHDGRLNERHERHVGVCCDSDRPQEIRRELRRQIDGRRSIGAADDADGGGFLDGEAEDHGKTEGYEDADLRRRSQEERVRIGNQRTEVRHRADAEEDQRRKDFVGDAEVDRLHDVHLFSEEARLRKIRQDTAKSDRAEEQRLELLGKGQIKKHESDENHDAVAHREVGKARSCPDGLQRYDKSIEEFHDFASFASDGLAQGAAGVLPAIARQRADRADRACRKSRERDGRRNRRDNLRRKAFRLGSAHRLRRGNRCCCGGCNGNRRFLLARRINGMDQPNQETQRDQDDEYDGHVDQHDDQRIRCYWL